MVYSLNNNLKMIVYSSASSSEVINFEKCSRSVDYSNTQLA